MHSVSSKHGRHILQLITTFITHHPTPQQWLVVHSGRATHEESLHTNTAPSGHCYSTDEDALPVSLMYTHFHHMHEPSTDRPLLDRSPCVTMECVHATRIRVCVPSTLTTVSDPLKEVLNLSPVFITSCIVNANTSELHYVSSMRPCCVAKQQHIM